MRKFLTVAAALSLAFSVDGASAEILAMMSYESKPAEDLKSLKLSGANDRREGIAIIEVDPNSPDFGKWLVDIPLDPKGVAHHLFYDRTMAKGYLTSLGAPSLQVMDMNAFPPRLTTIDIPSCGMAEDVIFDAANEYWYLTCMNSGQAWKGQVSDDAIQGEIKLPGTNPHGLAIATDIDRILVTSTIKGDLTDPGETISVIKASTLELLGEIKVSTKPSPSGEAPVELLRAPGDGVPTFLVTNMFGASIWALRWNAEKQDFDPSMIFDFSALDVGVPLELYFNPVGDRLYATTSAPGHLHIFDVSGGVLEPKLITSIATAKGAHHVAFTKDMKYGFVQNSFLNLPEMRDGSITVVDLEQGKAVASMDTLKDAGLNPNVIVLLPQWNELAGH